MSFSLSSKGRNKNNSNWREIYGSFIAENSQCPFRKHWKVIWEANIPYFTTWGNGCKAWYLWSLSFCPLVSRFTCSGTSLGLWHFRQDIKPGLASASGLGGCQEWHPVMFAVFCFTFWPFTCEFWFQAKVCTRRDCLCILELDVNISFYFCGYIYIYMCDIYLFVPSVFTYMFYTCAYL